jgi:2-aminophenol/2-amino-5-chlorophenol 1,6-dioxygenase alpha subunit
MPAAAAFLVPGLPHPLLKPDVPAWGQLATALSRAGRSMAAAKPDTLVVYSTQWMAVLDQLWQTRPHLKGLHVDENWYEYGELSYDIAVDTELAYACVASTPRAGIQSKGVNYDGFPIDTGSIVANHFLNQARAPLVLTSNNLYHGWDETKALGRLAVEKAEELGRRVAVVGVGGLSGAMYREEIDPRQDRVLSDEADRWNRTVLDLLERGDVAELGKALPAYAKEAKPDMGFKHLAFLLGALGDRFFGARVHGYGPIYGSGAAVVEFRL